MISVPAAGLYDANDPSAEISYACSACGHEPLTEDDATNVEGDVKCRADALEHLSQLAQVVLGHDYRRAAKLDAAERLDAEMVTLKDLIRQVEIEVNRIKAGRW